MSNPMHDMPDHLMMAVDETGAGPVPAISAVGEACWCGCPNSFKTKTEEIERERARAWRAGYNAGHECVGAAPDCNRIRNPHGAEA